MESPDTMHTMNLHGTSNEELLIFASGVYEHLDSGKRAYAEAHLLGRRAGIAYYGFLGTFVDWAVISINEATYNHDSEDGLFSIEEIGANSYTDRISKYLVEVGTGIREVREEDYWL